MPQTYSTVYYPILELLEHNFKLKLYHIVFNDYYVLVSELCLLLNSTNYEAYDDGLTLKFIGIGYVHIKKLKLV
jgi:hypothetical protein